MAMALSHEQKALEILRAIARAAADGNSLTIAHDWGFGSATIIDQSGAHTHIGDDGHDNEQRNLEAFVDGLHDVLVKGRGLSWVKPLAAAKPKTLEARALLVEYLDYNGEYASSMPPEDWVERVRAASAKFGDEVSCYHRLQPERPQG